MVNRQAPAEGVGDDTVTEANAGDGDLDALGVCDQVTQRIQPAMLCPVSGGHRAVQHQQAVLIDANDARPSPTGRPR